MTAVSNCPCMRSWHIYIYFNWNFRGLAFLMQKCWLIYSTVTTLLINTSHRTFWFMLAAWTFQTLHILTCQDFKLWLWSIKYHGWSVYGSQKTKIIEVSGCHQNWKQTRLYHTDWGYTHAECPTKLKRRPLETFWELSRRTRTPDAKLPAIISKKEWTLIPLRDLDIGHGFYQWTSHN